MKNKIFVFLVLVSNWIFGQAPNWSVDVDAYQFSMTMTLFLSHNNQKLNSTNDQVAAFVGEELRGTTSLTYVSTADKYVAYLTVYSNTIGETVQFKFYNSTTQEVVTAPQTTTFEIDGNKGSLFQAYSVAQPQLSQTAVLSSFGIKDTQTSSMSITSNKVQFAVPFGTDVTQMIPEFSTENNASVYINYQKQLSGQNTVDFNQPVIYQVLSEDETVLRTYEVAVTVLSNTALNNVFISAPSIEGVENPFEVNIQFDQPVVSIPTEAFEMENLVVYNWSKTDNLNHSLDVMLVDSKEKGSFKIKAGTIKDLTDNYNQASNLLEFSLDDQHPYIESIVASELRYTITFSEPVLGVELIDFELKGIAADAYTLQALNQIDTQTFQLVLTAQQQKNGEVFPILKSNHQIKDSAGNTLYYSQHDWVQVDHTTPTILSKESLQIDVSGLDNYELGIDEVDLGSTDRFGIASQTLSQTVFTKEDVGEIMLTYEVADVLGNVASTEIQLKVIDTTLSNSNPELRSKMNLYPNPVYDGLHIKMKNSEKLREVVFYSVSGKIIKSLVLDAPEVWVKCIDLEAGIYFVEVQTRSGRIVEKIIKL